MVSGQNSRVYRFKGWLCAIQAGGLLLACLAAAEPAAGEDDEALVKLESLLRRSHGMGMSQQVARLYMLEILRQDKVDAGMAVLRESLRDSVTTRSSSVFTTADLEAFFSSADALRFLQIVSGHGAAGKFKNQAVAEWLLGSNLRLASLVETLDAADFWPGCRGIIETLYAHDPQGREDYIKLILALAVVWDQPRRPLHHQIGQGALPYEVEITRRYDYFKDLYASRKARISYGLLSVSALTLVVDTPVPVTELEWARDNVRGSRTRWGSKFSDIKYDHPRLDRGQYVWPHGSYTLASIEARGGICVDQAYYAAMTARAAGLPAIFFSGEGRRGGHAWFGYLTSETNWTMDIGRYEYDDYVTGHAINPQTNQPMTDHDVQFSCDRILYADQFFTAARYTRLAQVMLDLEQLSAAGTFANRALRLARFNPLAWNILEQVLVRQKKLDECVRLLNTAAETFSRYPDMIKEIRTRQARMLTELGRGDEARKLLATTESMLGRKREDLGGQMTIDRINTLIREGANKQAREEFEKLLMEMRDSGAKAYDLARQYVEFTGKTDQSEEAASFLRRLIRRLRNLPDNYQRQFEELVIQAFENAGDTKSAERLRRRL